MEIKYFQQMEIKYSNVIEHHVSTSHLQDALFANAFGIGY